MRHTEMLLTNRQFKPSPTSIWRPRME